MSATGIGEISEIKIMSKQRMERVSELIRETVGDILVKVKDPRIGFVTVTDVEISPDLNYAKIFVSILGTEEERKNSLAGLDAASGFIGREVGKQVHLRKIPKLSFRFDPGIERGARIIHLLGSLNTESNQPTEAETHEEPVRND